MNKDKFGLQYLLGSRFDNRNKNHVFLLYILVDFIQSYKCAIYLYWKPIFHLLLTFFVFIFFYLNNILLVSLDFLMFYRFFRLFLFFIFVFFILLLLFIFLKKNKYIINWYNVFIFILKSFFKLLSIFFNIYLFLYIFDIKFIEFLQYTLILQVYLIFFILVEFYCYFFKKQNKLYKIIPFYYYPFFFTIFLLCLIFFKIDNKILNVFYIIIFYNNIYSDFLSIQLVSKTSILIVPSEQIYIKW